MYNLILASSSIRRKEILDKYNVKYNIITKDIKEYIDEKEKPEEIVMGLSFRKAYNVALDNKDSIVIGSDTIVVFEDEIMGKPKNTNEAFETLSRFSGKKQEVYSGISLINIKENIKVVDYDVTEVYFNKLTKEKIIKYIKTNEPIGKAGSYAIQGKGSILVNKINGSYDTVVGLPVGKLDKLLEKYFGMSLI